MAEDSSQKSTPAESGSEGVKPLPGNPISLQMPVDPLVWGETRKLAGDKGVRVEDIATCAAQDPIIVLDLLRIANAMFFSGGRSPITTAKTAIIRLGYDVVLDTLDKLRDRPRLDDPAQIHWFELHRGRCRRASIVSRILAEAVARQLSEECQMAALMLYVGEMLAVLNFRQRYVALAQQNSRASLNYRLSQDCKFDVERMGLLYLKRNGIHDSILFAVDRDGRTKSKDRLIMKPICHGAAEMVEAFDNDRWDKLSPGKALPPKSSVRFLQMDDAQYVKVYERVSEFFHSYKALAAIKQQAADVAVAKEKASTKAKEIKSAPSSDESTALDDEIKSLISGINEAEPEEIPEAPLEEAPLATKPKSQAPNAPPAPPLTSEERDKFSLSKTKPASRTSRVPRGMMSSKVEEKPELPSAKGKEVAGALNGMMEKAKSAEELLSGLLEMLVDKGPFEKSALIVVSKDRSQAVVVAARGPNIGQGQRIAITDPLSPLGQCLSKIQSFGSREVKESPFGSKSFAVSPIDADHATPVALYADCGNDSSITFEARRIFRTVVEELNKTLPKLPGGIPVEIS